MSSKRETGGFPWWSWSAVILFGLILVGGMGGIGIEPAQAEGRLMLDTYLHGTCVERMFRLLVHPVRGSLMFVRYHDAVNENLLMEYVPSNSNVKEYHSRSDLMPAALKSLRIVSTAYTAEGSMWFGTVPTTPWVSDPRLWRLYANGTLTSRSVLALGFYWTNWFLSLGIPPAGRADQTLYYYGGDCIYAIRPNGTIEAVVSRPGQRIGFYGDGVPGRDALVSTDLYLSAADDGRLYFSDTGNHRVRMLDPAGLVHTVVGSGEPGGSGDGGPARSAQLYYPTAVYVAGNDTLYVADLTYRIRRVDLRTGVITTVAGSGLPGYAGDGRPAVQGRLGMMTSLVGFDETVYVAGVAMPNLNEDPLFCTPWPVLRRILPAPDVAAAVVMVEGFAQGGLNQELVLLVTNEGSNATAVSDGDGYGRGSGIGSNSSSTTTTVDVDVSAGLTLLSVTGDANANANAPANPSTSSAAHVWMCSSVVAGVWWRCTLTGGSLTPGVQVQLIAKINIALTALPTGETVRMRVNTPGDFNAANNVLNTTLTIDTVIVEPLPGQATTERLALVAAVVASSLTLAGVVALYALCRRRERRRKYRTAVRVELLSLHKIGHTEIDWASLELGRCVGDGNSASVYKSVWQGADVAVKVFHSQPGVTASTATDPSSLAASVASSAAVALFENELAMNTVLGNHPRVVNVLGGSCTPPHAFVVLSFMPFGSMEQVLIGDGRFPVHPHVTPYELLLNLRQVNQMLVHAASGLMHVHAQGVVHRDVGARNFLVDQYQHVTICDFGLSRLLPAGHAVGVEIGTALAVKWCAPEALLKGHFSVQTDVYSFGMMLYEVVARRDPFEDIPARDVAPKIHNYQRLFRPEIPPECPREWAELIQECWRPYPQDRPTMDEVFRRLKAFLVKCLAASEDDVLNGGDGTGGGNSGGSRGGGRGSGNGGSGGKATTDKTTTGASSPAPASASASPEPTLRSKAKEAAADPGSMPHAHSRRDAPLPAVYRPIGAQGRPRRHASPKPGVTTIELQPIPDLDHPSDASAHSDLGAGEALLSSREQTRYKIYEVQQAHDADYAIIVRK